VVVGVQTLDLAYIMSDLIYIISGNYYKILKNDDKEFIFIWQMWSVASEW